ncbi:Z1 domain-containing protein [uncultured Agrobacterium sp.]|uniref:Z1 domain-containing protein n=1 Tax=uncultured Agrobacterium sp. TaxID=157277 RepID=UPI0025EDE34D|nr:Z1 domain-containing protein [uncultured Agrobacterium sp.]
MNPVTQLANTARVALGPKAGDRTLSVDEIRAVVAASAQLVTLTTGQAVGAEEIEAATQDLQALFVVAQGPSIRLQNDQLPTPWYIGEKRRPGNYLKRYLQKLAEDNWAPRALEVLEESTSEVIELIEDPQRPGPWDWRGLVVGNVQSGKTAHYAGVINRAADVGYRVIIVLAGMHNVLRRQTQLRLDQDFLGFDTAGVNGSGGRRPIGVGMLPGPVMLVDSLTTSELNGDFNRTVAQNSNFAPGERPFIFVIKKNGGVLKNLNRWIARLPAPSREAPLLVIDDEADQASPDTGDQGFLPDGTFDEDYDPKRINGEIRKLLSSFSRSVYVGYTATPFANIMIHDERTAEDYGPDLFPSTFILSLSAPDDYFGPLAVFGRDDDADSGGLPVTRHLDQTAEAWIPDPHDKTLRPVWQGQPRVPPSLARAMRSFIIACAARAARGQVNAHRTMLVHVSRFQDVHDIVHAQVEAELRVIRNAVAAGDSVELIGLEKLWVDDFEPTSVAIAPTVFGRAIRRVNWTDVVARLPDEIDRIQVAVANGRSRTGIDYDAAEAAGQSLSVIVIGGDKLSRGLTLEGLSTSYFLRISRQYDSLLQMGRWFGYRRGYADLCRLYTTPDMEAWFRHLATVNEDLRAQLAHMKITLARPKDYGFSIATHSVMTVTAANKRRYAVERPVSYGGEGKIQTVQFRDTDNVTLNAAAIDSLLQELGTPQVDPPRPGGRGNASGLLWRGVVGHKIAALLGSVAFPSESTDVDGRRMSAYISTQLARGELTNWTIFVPAGTGAPVSVGGHSLRSVRRSSIARTDTRFITKSILSPLDEAIDLSDGQYFRALEETNRILEVKGEPPTDRPSGAQIRVVRGDDPRSGLLLLYPVDPANAELEAGTPLYGVVVSFPRSPTAAAEWRLENSVQQRGTP